MFPPSPSSSPRPTRCLKRKTPESDESESPTQPNKQQHCKCDCATFRCPHRELTSITTVSNNIGCTSLTTTTTTATTTTTTSSSTPLSFDFSIDLDDDEKENTLLPPFACLSFSSSNFSSSSSLTDYCAPTPLSPSTFALPLTCGSNNTGVAVSSSCTGNSSSPLPPSPSFLSFEVSETTNTCSNNNTLTSGQQLSDALQEQCRLDSSSAQHTPTTTLTNVLPSSDNQLLRSCLTSNARNGFPNSYQHERHLLFNLSMSKLNKFRCSNEPSLLRSVLICNTLKRLERQLDQNSSLRYNSQQSNTTTTSCNNNNDPSGESSLQSSCNNAIDTSSNEFGSLTNNNNLSSLDCLSSTMDTTSLLQDDLLQPPSPPATDSIEDADKFLYLYLDLDGTSTGRLTPFIRDANDEDNKKPSTQSEIDSCSSSLPTGTTSCWSSSVASSASSTSTATSTCSDRLTNLNWSSMLSFETEPKLATGATPMSLCNNSSVEDLDASACAALGELINAANEPSDSGCESILENSSIDSSSISSRSSSCLQQLHTLQPLSSSTESIAKSLTTSSNVTHISASTNNNRATHPFNPLQQLNQFTSGALNDEIFGDIDLSLYDFDLFTPLSPPNVKLSPVSAEELMRSLVDASNPSSCCSSSNTFTAVSFGDFFSSTGNSCNNSLSNISNGSMTISSSSSTVTTSGSASSAAGCATSAAAAAASPSGVFQSPNAGNNIPTVIS